MSNCNIDSYQSQNITYINSNEFNNLYIIGKPLRIMLLQYSTIWSYYDIRNIKAIVLSKNDNNNNNNTNTINDIDISISKQISDDMIVLSNIQKSEAKTTDYSLYKLTKKKSGTTKKKKKKEKVDTSIDIIANTDNNNDDKK